MKIKALGYIAIESTEPSEWTAFMTEVVGFMPAPAQQDKADLYFKMDEYSWRVKVFQGERNCLAVAGWECATKQDFDQAIEELKIADVALEVLSAEECDDRLIREAVRFKDPGGNTIELFHNMKLDYVRVNSPANVKSFETGYHGDMGLGHFVIPTAQFTECHDFYVNTLGFGETDYMEFNFIPEVTQGLHFLHVGNPRHHSLAIYHDPNPPESNCVHLMFEVKDVDEVGYFIDRCKQHDVKIVSSLGRHTNDLMLSVYVASPGGFAIEFGCEGVQLDWEGYTPTESSVPSLWGHDWQL
jgi:3,4-dihydroxy-9,10-secoandrosta-1,3,5(10)-triene-9,17-dione 4,5-dioxygenase